MDARALIEDFSRRGIRLIPNPPRLTVEPASRLSDADRAAIRASKPELLRILAGVRPSAIIEATCRTASAPSTAGPIEFPACPVCGSVRYWLASGGRVLCGTKQCASAQR